MTALIDIVVRDRQGIKFDGKAKAVTAFNDTGKFDILPHHANFITILRKKMTIHKSDGNIDEFNVENGIMRVTGDKIDVYLGVK